MIAGFTFVGYSREGECLGVFEREDGMSFIVKVPDNVDWSLPGERLFVNIYHHINEQGQALYGFPTWEDRRLFVDLISVDGVGPTLALKIMSFYDPEKIRIDIGDGDKEDLCKAKGVGAKTADKIISALKEKYKKFATVVLPDKPLSTIIGSREKLSGELKDIGEAAVKALIKLGWKKPEAEKRVKEVANCLPSIISSTYPDQMDGPTQDKIASKLVTLALSKG